MIKIFFLIRSLNIGGAERQLTTLVKYMDKTKFDITVAFFYGSGALEKELRNCNIRLINLNKKGRWDLVFFTKKLVKILKREKQNILYSWLGGPNIIGLIAGRLAGVSKIIWGVRASNMDLEKYGKIQQLAYWVESKMSRFPDFIIANSYAGRDYAIKHGFLTEKFIVIPNGIDTERFKPMPKKREIIRKEWGIKDNEILVGTAARLDLMKGYETFLKASSIVAKRKRNVKFACVGDGPEEYRRKLQNLSKQLKLEKHLIWAGPRSDMPEAYNAFDISSSSSSYGEGFSNSIAEAMSCGTPCVVTDVGDSAKIVGNTGIVVPPKNPTALAEGLEKIIEMEAKKKIELGETARKRIVDNFDIKKIVKKNERIFIEIVKV